MSVLRSMAALAVASVLTAGCATAPPAPEQKPVKMTRQEAIQSRAAIHKKCQAYGDQVFARYKAIGPIIVSPISLVATLADPDWRAKNARSNAIARCLDAGGNI